MSREHELILELRAARKTVRDAEIQEQEARVKVAERKAARMKAAAAVEEILAEMDGTSDRPLIDAINGKSQAAARVPAKGAAAAVRDAREFVAAGKPPDPPEEPESADERQRGPTAAAEGPMCEWHVHRATSKGGLTGAVGTVRARNPRDASIEAQKQFGPDARLGDQIVGPKPPARKKQTERADRRETVISPKGPIRQEQYVGPDVDELVAVINDWRNTPLHLVLGETLAQVVKLGYGWRTLGEMAKQLESIPTDIQRCEWLGKDQEKIAHAIWAWRLARGWKPTEGFPADLIGIPQPNAQSPENASGSARPQRKTYAVYVRDPVDHSKAARGLGYIDAASKDKALAMATKKWPAVKPSEILISPPGWESSPPPAEPERPKPLPADPSKVIDDHFRQTDLKKTDGEPDPTVSPWVASVPVGGPSAGQIFLGSFLATDEADAYAVANARWPGYDGSLEVRRSGLPISKPTPVRKRKPKAQPAGV